MSKALLVIDLQNDYFQGGYFPLWNTDNTLDNIEAAISLATAQGIPVVHVQHLADPEIGSASFLTMGTEGAAIHPRILAAAPDAAIVVKQYADSFYRTNLDTVLSDLGVTELLVCGMMTQNCVTHTAISTSAEKYQVSILADCCTTVDAMIHNIALRAVSTRLAVLPASTAFGMS
ncbi:MAG: cysteine hydrolase [Undibacterium sp.]|nr:cysteine hydrolase [Undibacterium sp.]